MYSEDKIETQALRPIKPKQPATVRLPDKPRLLAQAFYHCISGIFSKWITRDLELFWFLLRYSHNNAWIILIKRAWVIVVIFFSTFQQCLVWCYWLSSMISMKAEAISLKCFSYYQNLELFSFWNRGVIFRSVKKACINWTSKFFYIRQILHRCWGTLALGWPNLSLFQLGFFTQFLLPLINTFGSEKQKHLTPNWYAHDKRQISILFWICLIRI